MLEIYVTEKKYKMGEKIITVLLGILVATSRLTWGPFTMILPTKSNAFEISFIETFVYTSIGGVLGTYFYYYLGINIITFFKKRRNKRILLGKAKPRKIFTKTNRKIIRIKNKFGVIGVAFLTPPIFSIMIGSVLCSKMYKHNKITIPALLISVLFWSFLASLGWYHSFEQLDAFFNGNK